MTVSIVAVGDVCVGGPVQAFDPSPDTLWSMIGEADLAVANLESTLTDRGMRADKAVTLRADPAVVKEIDRLGFNAVTFATNHTMDYGSEGMEHTQQVLNRQGIAHCGAGQNYAEAARATTCQVRDLRVGLLSFASTVPPGATATEYRPGVAAIRVTTNYVIDSEINDEQPGSSPYIATHFLESDVEAAAASVKQACQEHDFVVVGLHWGVMPLWLPPLQGALADYQRPLAHRLIDAGADLILGGHPHVPQGVEVYREKLIIYCLGNFIFHRLPQSDWDLNRPGPRYDQSARRLPELQNIQYTSGCLLQASIDASGIKKAELVPYWLNENKEPLRAQGDEARKILQLVKVASPEQGHFLVDGAVGHLDPSLFGR